MAHIGIVEDNADNRLLLDALLGDEHQLDHYEDGAAALVGLPRRVPDLVLLDISLPGMDGVAVLRALREIPAFAQRPIIALTAHAMTGDRERFLEQGFDDYIRKPIVDVAVVYRVLDRFLNPSDA